MCVALPYSTVPSQLLCKEYVYVGSKAWIQTIHRCNCTKCGSVLYATIHGLSTHSADHANQRVQSMDSGNPLVVTSFDNHSSHECSSGMPCAVAPTNTVQVCLIQSTCRAKCVVLCLELPVSLIVGVKMVWSVYCMLSIIIEPCRHRVYIDTCCTLNRNYNIVCLHKQLKCCALLQKY